MPSIIKPIRRYKRTAWKKQYLTQSQRWGKVVITKMPTPQGDITSTEILKPKEEPKEETK